MKRVMMTGKMPMVNRWKFIVGGPFGVGVRSFDYHTIYDISYTFLIDQTRLELELDYIL